MIGSMIALSIGLAIPGFFLLNGDSAPPTGQADAPSTMAEGLAQAAQVQDAAALKQAEMELQACFAQTETFVGCPAITTAQLVRAEPTNFLLQLGSLSASYDATTGRNCHFTAAEPTRCDAW